MDTLFAERFNYPDGTTSFPDSTVWGGGVFTTVDGRVKTTEAVGNSRIAWDTGANGRWSADFYPPTQPLDKNVAIFARAVDETNYWVFRLNHATDAAVVIVERYINGSKTTLFNNAIDWIPNTLNRNLAILANGSNIKFLINDTLIHEENDSTHENATLAGVRVDSNVFEVDNFIYHDYVTPVPSVRTEYIQSGQGRYAEKLGNIFEPFAVMSSEGAEEFWPYAISTEGLPSWPSTKYPVILYSSTDHALAGGLSGIFVRVYNSELGSIESAASWEEWDDVSNRSEFSHITQKTNPIYVDGSQTETPTVIMRDGVAHMFYHKQSVDMGYGRNVQNTCLARGTNGIDFTLVKRGVVSYNPYNEQGDGHTGYFMFIDNIFNKHQYDYIGFSIHGGSGKTSGATTAFWGSNDLENWEIIDTFGWLKGELMDYMPSYSTDWILRSVWLETIRREGPYYRVVISAISDIPDNWGGQPNTPFIPMEFLIDDDFNVVSAPNILVSNGEGAAYDRFAIDWGHEFTYSGGTYTFVKNIDHTDTGKIGMLKMTTGPKDWTVFRSHYDRQTLQSIDKENYGSATLSANSTATDNSDTVNISLPATGELASISGNPIVLDDYDMVDLVIKRHGRVTNSDISGEVGFFDSLTATTKAVSLVWPSHADNVQPLKSKLTLDGGYFDLESRKYVGLSSIGGLEQGYEEGRSKTNYGIRIIPAERRAFVMDGVSPVSEFDLRNLDLSTPLIPAIQMKSNDSTARDTEFESMSIYAYSNDEKLLNQVPVADAGEDQSNVNAGDLVTLSGAGSYDNDGTVIEYRWREVTSSGVTISDENGETITFTSPSTGADQTITFGLIVMDDYYDLSDEVFVNVHVNKINNAPVFVDTTGPTNSEANTDIIIEGNFTDNGALSYSVAVTPSGVSYSSSENIVSLNTGKSVNQRDIVITFTATDEGGLSATGTHTVNVEPYDAPIGNTAPTAKITGNTTGTVGTEQTFSAATSTDPESDALAYSWVLTVPSGSSATLTNASGETTAYIPDIPGSYTLSLTADDGDLSGSDSLLTAISEASNNAKPTAPTTSGVTRGQVNTDYDIVAAATDDGGAGNLVYEVTVTPASISYIQDGDTVTVSTGSYVGNINLTFRAFDGELYSDPVTHTIAVSNNAQESTANLTIIDIPDGQHPIKLWSEDTDEIIYSASVSFINGSASITVPVTAGVSYSGRWKGANPPGTGTGIWGVTV